MNNKKMTITITQNKIIHALLGKVGLMAHKADIVAGITSGRSSSSKDMTVDEAKAMITYLRTLSPAPSSDCFASFAMTKRGDSANKMRRKLISLAYEMLWAEVGNWKAAVAALDGVLTSPKSLFKKPLKKHSYTELVKVVSQFEQMYKKHLHSV